MENHGKVCFTITDSTELYFFPNQFIYKNGMLSLLHSLWSHSFHVDFDWLLTVEKIGVKQGGDGTQTRERNSKF